MRLSLTAGRRCYVCPKLSLQSARLLANKPGQKSELQASILLLSYLWLPETASAAPALLPGGPNSTRKPHKPCESRFAQLLPSPTPVTPLKHGASRISARDPELSISTCKYRFRSLSSLGKEAASWQTEHDFALSCISSSQYPIQTRTLPVSSCEVLVKS